MALNMIVCVKQVPDPEAPASAFKVDEAAKRVIPAGGVAQVVSQFDGIAVEAALRIKDALGDGKITIISMGPASARDAIKHGLAMGADEGVLLSDDAFENVVLGPDRRLGTGLAVTRQVDIDPPPAICAFESRFERVHHVAVIEHAAVENDNGSPRADGDVMKHVHSPVSAPCNALPRQLTGIGGHGAADERLGGRSWRI